VTPFLRSLVLLLLTASVAAAADLHSHQTYDVVVRGKHFPLELYRPASGPSTGTILMGSGDVGWVGLAASLAEFLSDRGYTVAGVNTRRYLSMFREGKKHLKVDEPAGDYRTIYQWLAQQHWATAPIIVSGVSEGAAMAVLAASGDANRDWINGVVTMGIPATAELAWKWTDFTSWITKSDANEPSFSPFDFVGGISPVPFAMLQSKKDEYVPEEDYRRCYERAQHPKRLVLIDASNHRFTDRQRELRQEYLAALDWVKETMSR
jgi:alpha-beta hydrolase superfamily lysophospholipase